MRYLTILSILLFLISCSSTPKKALLTSETTNSQDACKKEILDELKYMGSRMVIGKGKVYTFDHSRMELPHDFEKVVWNTLDGEFTGMDSIDMSLMLFAKALEKLLINPCQISITRQDIKENFPLPSADKHPFMNTYFFNKKRSPDCFNEAGYQIEQYHACGVISFVFNRNDELVETATINFFPYNVDLGRK